MPEWARAITRTHIKSARCDRGTRRRRRQIFRRTFAAQLLSGEIFAACKEAVAQRALQNVAMSRDVDRRPGESKIHEVIAQLDALLTSRGPRILRRTTETREHNHREHPHLFAVSTILTYTPSEKKH